MVSSAQRACFSRCFVAFAAAGFHCTHLLGNHTLSATTAPPIDAQHCCQELTWQGLRLPGCLTGTRRWLSGYRAANGHMEKGGMPITEQIVDKADHANREKGGHDV